MKQIVKLKVLLLLLGFLLWLRTATAQSYWVKPLAAIDSRQSFYFYQDSRPNTKTSFIIANRKESRGILGLGLAKSWRNSSFTDVAVFFQNNSSAQLGFFLDTMGANVTSTTAQVGLIKESKFVLEIDHLIPLTKSEKIFRFYAGASMAIHSVKNNFKANPLYYFDIDKRFSNIDLGGILKISYTVLDNLWAELGLSAGLISLGVEDSQVSNPSLTPNQQQTSTFNVDLLSSSNIRLGLGYRFYHKKVKK